MPRIARRAPAGIVFHVLNRANARAQMFEHHADFAVFARVLAETQARVPTRILAYSLMPNHWYLVLWPWQDSDLAAFMQRLTTTHVRRWHLARHSVGAGHLYQGTYKSFPIREDDYLLTVCRYVERNPVRAKLVERAEDWPWSSLWQRLHVEPGATKPALCEWPVQRPEDWLEWVNRPKTGPELEAVRGSVVRGRPFGAASWQRQTAAALGLEATFRTRGRPRNPPPNTGV